MKNLDQVMSILKRQNLDQVINMLKTSGGTKMILIGAMKTEKQLGIKDRVMDITRGTPGVTIQVSSLI